MRLQSMILGALVLCTYTLDADVEQVVLRWTPETCTEGCGEIVKKNLEKMRGAASVSVSEVDGQATIRWKPSEKFSFAPINTQMRLSGPRVRDVRVRVRGTIQHSGENVYLISLGDNTRFELIGIPTPDQTGYVEENNIANRQLSQQTKERLIATERTDQLITVEGPLFQPTRSPLRLVTEWIDIGQRKQQ